MDNHKSHRPGTFEEWEQRMITSGQKGRDEYEFYKRSNFALPRTWFVPDCPLCIEVAEKKAKYEEEMRRQDEEYMQRQKEWEEAEKAKSRAPAPAPAPRVKPPPPAKQTPQELEQWRVLCEQEKAIQQELGRIRARMTAINPKHKHEESKYTCEACNVDYCGGGAYPNAALRKRHIETDKHKRNVGLIQVDVYPKHCDKCDYTAKTKHYWEQHCEGKKHKAKEEQSCVVPTTDDFSATDNGTP